MRGNIVVDNDKWWKVTFQFADRLDPDVMAIRRHSLIMAAWVLNSLLLLERHTDHNYQISNSLCYLCSPNECYKMDRICPRT
jgi:hypothetical protein